MGDPQNPTGCASSSPTSSSPLPPASCVSHEAEELRRLEQDAPFCRDPKPKKRLSKQLSMYEGPCNRAWERRRRQILQQERRSNNIVGDADDRLTDDDLNELRGCIELGFGFNEENGQRLCPTIPALDLYFAVNRQFSISPISSPASTGSTSTPSALSGGGNSSAGSPMSDSDSHWKIFNPGDDPQQVKTRLRHWAQAVACSVMQSPLRGEMDSTDKER